MLKFSAFEVLSAVLVTRDATHLQAQAALQTLGKRWDPTYEVRPGFLYVRSRAISSRTNDNYDEFPAEEIAKGYKTFIGKPVFVTHVNDNHRRARGVIIDAHLHRDRLSDGSPDTWCEVLMEVDATKFPKLAKAILEKRVDRTSMGTDVDYSICSACGNKATTPMEYCQHIPRLKGKKILKRNAKTGAQESHLIREICYGLRFFENSLLVEPPADPTAFFTGVDASGFVKAASVKVADQIPWFQDHGSEPFNSGHLHETPWAAVHDLLEEQPEEERPHTASLIQAFAGLDAKLWPDHPLFRPGDRVVYVKGQQAGTVESVDEHNNPDHPGRVWTRRDGDDYPVGIHPSHLAPHPDAPAEQHAHYRSQQAKNDAGEPYIPEGERDIDESDRETVHHLTDDPHFSPSTSVRPNLNTTIGGSLSPRLFVGDPTTWAEGQHHYRRPYVAEMDAPKQVVKRSGGYLGEGEIMGRHFDKVNVKRVLPYDEFRKEQDEDGYKSPVDARTWSPEQHQQHLEKFRNHLHDKHNWGWNEFDENHNFKGLGDEDWDDDMPDPSHGYPGTYVRRDRNGEVMKSVRSSLTQMFSSGFGTGDADRWTTCDQGHRHWGAAGAAGLLIHHRDDSGTHRYLLQQRAPWVDEGNTWGIPAGALHHGEDSLTGAVRESHEELGGVPQGLKHVRSYPDDHGGWAFTTHLVDSPSRWGSSGGKDADHEVGPEGTRWFTSEEMKDIPLHPGFQKSWEGGIRDSIEGQPKTAKTAGQKSVWPVRVMIKDRATGKYTGKHVGNKSDPSEQWPFKLCDSHYKQLSGDIARHNREETNHPHTYEPVHDTWPVQNENCHACTIGDINRAMA
jgi:8-oxo-dGTP pyrophosphatase MutT (NUDIX family)